MSYDPLITAVATSVENRLKADSRERVIALGIYRSKQKIWTIRWLSAMLLVLMLLLVTMRPMLAQEVPAQTAPGGRERPGGLAPQTPLTPPTAHESYVLGAGDQIVIHAFEMEDISEKPYLIDNDGNVRIPLLGQLKAGGLTVAEFQTRLIEALSRYVQQPQVTVTVAQFHTEPIFLLGAFKSPGIYALEGKRTLVDMLAISGGLLPDASLQIKLTRRVEYGPIPLPGAVRSADGKTESITVNVVGIGETANPAENIFVQPYDVITVDLAEQIYVDGQIGHVQGLAVNQKTSMTLLQVLALSGGTTAVAKAGKSWILRPVPNSKLRTRIPLNIDRIVQGKDPDVELYPNDFLYIPAKNFQGLGRAVQIGIPIALGLIYLVLR